MTRQEQLEFCEKCLLRKMDPRQGLVCQLTNEKATFQKTCPDFKEDEEVVNRPMENLEGLTGDALSLRLSSATMKRLRSEQNLPFGIVAASVAGILGGVIWAAITVATEIQFGLVAILVGAMVGLSMRFVGKGIDQVFAFWGAGIALASVVLGNGMSIIGLIAASNEMTYWEVITMVDWLVMLDILIDSAGIMDLLFYVLATVEGYKFSFRVIEEGDMDDAHLSKGNYKSFRENRRKGMFD